MGRIQNLLRVNSQDKDKLDMSSDVPVFHKPLWLCLLCELLGTFLLIFIGCGVGLKFSEDEEDKPLVHVALCWGFLIASLAQTLHYSCDLNPAVTLAFLVTGKTTPVRAVLYIIVECVGCTAGAYALKLLTPSDIIGGFGMSHLAPELTVAQGVVIEAICTFLLVFIIFSASDHERTDLKGSVPLSVGLGIAGLIMTAAPYTSASFNPARTLGPSIVANNWDHHWIYWVGPITGGIVSGLTYHHIFRLRRINNSEMVPPSAV